MSVMGTQKSIRLNLPVDKCIPCVQNFIPLGRIPIGEIDLDVQYQRHSAAI
jgi:hypothetical protein